MWWDCASGLRKLVYETSVLILGRIAGAGFRHGLGGDRHGAIVLSDSTVGRVLFFGQAQSNNELVTVMHVFDQRTFLRLQSVILTDVPGQVSRAVRCGANGLALLANNRVYLLNTNLLDVSASNLPAAPVSVSAASYQPVVADKAREICLSSWRKTPRQHRAPARFWWLAQHCRLCRPDATSCHSQNRRRRCRSSVLRSTRGFCWDGSGQSAHPTQSEWAQFGND